MSHRSPRSLTAVLLIAALSVGFSDPVHDNSARGVKLYADGDYAGALEAFDRALEQQPDSPLLYFDRAATLYQAGMFEESAASYAVAASDPALAAPALYGAGNALANAGDLEKALEAYRQSLALNPADEDVKHNHERVQQMLEEQQQEQEQEQQQDGESDENQEEQEGEQENAPPDSSESGEDQQQDQGEEGEEEQQTPPEAEDGQGEEEQPEQPQEQEPQPGQVPPATEGMSQEDAERILEALAEEEEAERNAALEKRKARQKSSGKDW